MSHPEWNQCIECSVVSCKHHNDHGHCSLDKIKVEPTPMAYTGEAADESMCGNYNCKYFQEARGFGGSLQSLFIFYFRCQIFSLYSRIVRSEEKMPDLAVLITAIRSHLSRS